MHARPLGRAVAFIAIVALGAFSAACSPGPSQTQPPTAAATGSPSSGASARASGTPSGSADASGDTTPHYHLPSDTFDTVDLAYLASSTALLHATIGSLVATPSE